MAEDTNSRQCPRCGATILDGAAECLQCGNRWFLRLRSRETVLSLFVLGLIVFFLLTGMIVRNYHQKLQSLGVEWFKAGREQLKQNNPRAALADFRNSLVYNPDDAQVEFQLAEALSTEGRNEEAKSYLLGLLARAPSDAPVNLALARIAASTGSAADTLRYYHGAIYGIWPSNPEANRLDARLELCRFLLAEHDAANADSELIALVAEIPPRKNVSLHNQVGDLFLGAGDSRRALEEFRKALGGPHASLSALRGAGLAAYQMEDYLTAERYLERAERMKHDPQIAAALGTARLIVAWNPEAPGLRDAERRARVRHDLAVAISRAEACAKSSGMDLSSAVQKPKTQAEAKGTPVNAGAVDAPALVAQYALAKKLEAGLTNRNLSRNPKVVDEAIDAIFSLEVAATQKCGEPSGDLDKALEILGHNRQNSAP